MFPREARLNGLAVHRISPAEHSWSHQPEGRTKFCRKVDEVLRLGQHSLELFKLRHRGGHTVLSLCDRDRRLRPGTPVLFDLVSIPLKEPVRPTFYLYSVQSVGGGGQRMACYCHCTAVNRALTSNPAPQQVRLSHLPPVGQLRRQSNSEKQKTSFPSVATVGRGTKRSDGRASSSGQTMFWFLTCCLGLNVVQEAGLAKQSWSKCGPAPLTGWL